MQAEHAETSITPIYIYGAFDLMRKVTGWGGGVREEEEGRKRRKSSESASYHLVQGAVVPKRKGVVIVEYQKPIPFIPDMDHDKLKAQVDTVLHEVLFLLSLSLCTSVERLWQAERRWKGKAIPHGGYSLWWCMIPVFLLAAVAWQLVRVLGY